MQANVIISDSKEENKHVLSYYYVLGTVLSILHALSHLILATVL